MKPDKSPLTFRIEPELHRRLEKCAAETRLKKYALAILALEAAVEAIEKNDYELVVPIKFQVTRIPRPAEDAPKNLSGYPQHREELSTVEERPEQKRKAK
jgi:hypothetical protein